MSGKLSLYEVCEILHNNWIVEFNAEQKASYAFNESNWISFENEESLEFKVRKFFIQRIS
jgi:hypothetical protein